jgi:hypothetical protein
LREENVQVTGPYRTRYEVLVFSVGDSVVTEAEILQLQRYGKLNATLVAESIGRGR